MPDRKLFTPAELAEIEILASNANHAMAAYRRFLAFLRTQHDAPEADGWNLDEKGFGKQAQAAPAQSPNGKHEEIDEQVSALMRQ